MFKYTLRGVGLIKHAWPKIAGIVFIGVIASALATLLPILTKIIIDQIAVVQGNTVQLATPNEIWKLVGVLALVGIGFAFFETFERTISSRASTFFETELQIEMFKRLSNQSLDYFEYNRPGVLMNKLFSGLGALISWIGFLSDGFITPVFMVSFALILLYRTDVLIGLIATIAFPSVVIIFLITSKKARPFYQKSRKESEKADGHLSETFTHIATVRTMSNEQSIFKRYSDTVMRTRKLLYKDSNIWAPSIFIRVCINTFTFALGIGIISIAVINGKASIGDIAFVGLLMTQISSQTLSFGRFLDMNYRNDIKVERMLSILDAKPAFTDSESAKPVKSLESISFDNVSFDYPDGKKGAVKNLSFDIGHNKTIALVGPSGVGKSTITKLILSFYQPTKGKISINDHPSTDYKQESVRSHIAMVMQDVALFNTTIRENLNLANPKASFVEIEKAARLAHAHEFIKDLPKGYDTLVGERGVKLSGGQKQRIAIARAILKDPQLIILDEATSALDSESERLVQDGLKKLMQGRSALVIAHRLSTVMHADEILVLEKGTIIERGTHHELMKLSGGLYKKLFEMQSSSGKVAL